MELEIINPSPVEIEFPGSPEVEPKISFIKFPLWLIDSGLYSVIKPMSLRLYLLLLRRANFRTLQGYIYHKEIYEKLNISKRTLFRHFRDIVKFGLIEIKKDRKNLKYKKYKIVKNPSLIIKSLLLHSKTSQQQNKGTAHQRDLQS